MSVRLSVTLIWWIRTSDHIGWKSRKLIAWTISLTPSLFAAERPSTYSQGIIAKFGGDWKNGVSWSTKAAISLKRVKIEKKLLWEGYRNSPSLFRTVHPRPPTASPSQDLGLAPHPKVQSLLSQERVKLRTSNLARTITGSIRL